MEKAEYADKLILALRTKYQEKRTELLSVEKEIIIRGIKKTLNREVLFGGMCSILLPEIMEDMDDINKVIRYRNSNIPQVIKTDYESGATVTFDMLSNAGMMETKSLSEKMEKIREDIMKVWKQNVFYDRGEISAEEVLVIWMDFRAYCLNGSLYMMLFMFQIEEQIVLGNFHCGFQQYDIWKPVVIKLLTTIRGGS